MRGRWLVLVVLALGAGLPSVAPATSRATVPSGNLLANPGAEDGTGSTDSSCGAGGTTPGWMGTTGGFTAVQYGTSSYPSQSVSNAIGGGQNFFTGGCSDTASGSQFIDLSAYSADINAGHIRANLSAYLGGYLTQEDSAMVTVYFTYPGADTPLGSIVIGPVTAADRNDQTTLVYRQAQAQIPGGTTELQVFLQFTRYTGADDDGSADNVSVSLTDTSIQSPTNTAPPVISGQATVGQTVSCSTGTWNNNPTAFAYQWQLDGQPLTGETGSTHVIGSGEAGHQLTCNVTASNAGGSGNATSAAVVPAAGPPGLPASTGPPAISGNATIGQTVSCSSGTWSNSPTRFAYQWQLDGQPLAGQTSTTHAIAAGEAGHRLTCHVTATNGSGSASATSAAVTVAGSGGGGKPSLTPVRGRAAVGRALLFAAGGGGTDYNYRFSNDASATCTGNRPVLGAVFNAPLRGSVTLTTSTSAGILTATSPFIVTARKAGRAAVSNLRKARLVGYSCSPTVASAPTSTTLHQTLHPSPACLSSEQHGGYAAVRGCLSLVAFADLPLSDREQVPFAVHCSGTGKTRHCHIASRFADPTSDVFYASYGPVHINGLLVTPAAGHAIVLGEAGGNVNLANGVPDSQLANPCGYYVFSGAATAAVVAQGTSIKLQVTDTDRPLSWDVSLQTGCPNGDPRPNGNAPLGGIKLSNLASGIPSVGWLAGQVIESIPGADPRVATLAFTLKNGDFVTDIPLELTNLPFVNGAGSITLESDNDRLMYLGAFDLNVPDAFIGPQEFKNVGLHYTDHAGNVPCPGDANGPQSVPAKSIVGCAQAVIFNGVVTGRMVISEGSDGKPALNSFHIDYVGNVTLFTIPPGLDIDLTQASGDFNNDTGKLDLDAHVSIGGALGPTGCGIGGIHGHMTAGGSPASLDAYENVEMMCIQAGTGPGQYLHVDGDGNLRAGEYVDWSIPQIGSIAGSFAWAGYYDFKDGVYHTRGDANVSFTVGPSFPLIGGQTVGASAVVSDVGAAICTHVVVHTILGSTSFDVGVGALYNLSDIFNYPGGVLKYLGDHFDLKTSGCNVNDYSRIPQGTIPGSAADGSARPAAVGYSFRVPRNQRTTIVILRGAGGAPGAVLHGPAGQTIDATSSRVDASTNAIVLQLGSETEIMIRDAQPGRWTIAQAPGTPAIAEVDSSFELPPPVIRGRVTGSGANRTLHYQLHNLAAGATVTFVETGNGGSKLLGKAHGSRGSLHFSPGDARPGIRTIIAQITSGSGPQPDVVVTHYRGAPPLPGPITSLRVQRRGSSLRVTFRPASDAIEQLVLVRLSDGRRQLYVLGAHAHSVTIPGVPSNVHARSVVVRGRSRTGLLGPASTTHGG
jgi:hypothetical protein